MWPEPESVMDGQVENSYYSTHHSCWWRFINNVSKRLKQASIGKQHSNQNTDAMIPVNLVNRNYMPSHKILQDPVDADISFWCNSVNWWGGCPTTSSAETVFSLSSDCLLNFDWDNSNWQVGWLADSIDFELVFGAKTLWVSFLASIHEGSTPVTLWCGGWEATVFLDAFGVIGWHSIFVFFRGLHKSRKHKQFI